MKGKLHVHCNLCGHNEEVTDKDEEALIMASLTVIKVEVACNNCNEAGGLVVIGRDGKEIKYQGDKDQCQEE